MRQRARFYASRGLAVLPLWSTLGPRCDCGNLGCRSPGKHPLARLAPHGLDDASTDPAVIDEWFTRYPCANVGVRPPPGVLVLDVDPRHGGDVTLARLVETYGPLPRTLTAHTGGNGQHYWWAYSGPALGRIGPGLDTKAHAGYLVAPPSAHASGRRYRWTEQTVTAPAPGWLRALLDPPRRPRRPGTATGDSRGLVRVVADATEGNRNRLLHWAACRAHEDGRQDVLDALTVAAMAAGLPGHEVHRTVRSAERTVAR